VGLECFSRPRTIFVFPTFDLLLVFFVLLLLVLDVLCNFCGPLNVFLVSLLLIFCLTLTFL